MYLQETLLLEPMFEIPGSDVISVHIAEDVVLGKSEPIYIRGKPVSDSACPINVLLLIPNYLLLKLLNFYLAFSMFSLICTKFHFLPHLRFM